MFAFQKSQKTGHQAWRSCYAVLGHRGQYVYALFTQSAYVMSYHV